MKKQFLGSAIILALALVVFPAGLAAQAGPSDSVLYCAGFFTQREIPKGLFVETTEAAGFVNEMATGDYVYLNHGKDGIPSPAEEYMLLRPVRDLDTTQAYRGQAHLVSRLGTLYAEIALIQVQVLNDRSSTARIVSSCEPVHAGDIAVPFEKVAALRYRPSKFTPRFMPPSGKPIGTIVVAKDFDLMVGEGSIVYLDMGTAQGLQPGSYLAVLRSYAETADSDFGKAANAYPPDASHGNMSPKLTRAQKEALPREVVGEAMVLSAEKNSATAIITYSRTHVNVGDLAQVE